MTPGEWATMLGVAASLLVAVFAFVRGMRAERTSEKKATVEEQQAAFGANLQLNQYIDAKVEKLVNEQIQDVKTELKEERAARRTQTNAFIRILRSIAYQWPTGSPGPVLDPHDIAAVEETIPAQWLRPVGGGPERI